MIWGSGDVYLSELGRLYVGPLWFLFAMFICREVFYIIQCVASRLSRIGIDVRIGIATIVVLLSGLSIWVYPYVQPMAWNIFPGIAATIFYAIGWIIRRTNVPLWAIILTVVCWVAMIVLEMNMDMRVCEYGILPLNILGACGGTWLIYCVSKYLNKYSDKPILAWIARFLIWCGVSSLGILCIHGLDMLGGVSEYINDLVNGTPIVKQSLNFIIPLTLVWVISKIKLLKKVYY